MKHTIPPEHEQKHIIANTPEWLREHFKKEGENKTINKVIEEMRKIPLGEEGSIFNYIREKILHELMEE